MMFELSAGFRIYFLVLDFVLGAVLGSFINCLAWRKVHGVEGEKPLCGLRACAFCSGFDSCVQLSVFKGQMPVL